MTPPVRCRLLAALAATSMSMAVGANQPVAATPPTPTPSSDPTPSASTPADEPSADQLAISFPPVADTSRVVPVNGDLAEVVYALGLGDRVVATDISATYPAAARDTPKIGYQRTLTSETILTFEPTVVLADDRAGPPEVLDELRAVGVEVVVIEHRTDVHSPSYKIRAVASSLGVPAEGERLVDDFERDLAAAAELADDGIAGGGRPVVLALYLRGDGVQLAFGAGSGIAAVVEAAGGRNAGSEMGIGESGELSIEAMVAAAPDFLLVTTTGLESVGGVDGLLEVPGIAQTPAGANGDILVFEDQFLYGLGPRTGELVGELAVALHPPDASATSAPT